MVVTDTAGEVETLRHFFFGSHRELADYTREEIDDDGFNVNDRLETYPW